MTAKVKKQSPAVAKESEVVVDDPVTTAAEKIGLTKEKVADILDRNLEKSFDPWDPWGKPNTSKFESSPVITEGLKKKDIAGLELPYVVIGGKQYGSVGEITEPASYDENNNGFRFGRVGILPHDVQTKEDIVFKVFKVKIAKKWITLLLDNKSSFHIEEEPSSVIRSRGFSKEASHIDNSVLVLIDSTSLNDSFENNITILKRTRSENNHFVGTNTLTAKEENINGYYYGEYQAGGQAISRAGLMSDEESDNYQQFNNIDFVNATVKESVIKCLPKTAGVIFNSSLINVTFEGFQHYSGLRVEHSQLRNVALRGKNILVEFHTGLNNSISADLTINLGRYSLSNRRFVGEGYHGLTKFALLFVDTPEYEPYELQVINYNEAVIGYGRDKVKIKLDSDFETVKKAVKESITQYQYGATDVNLNSPIFRSIVNYIVDSIWSRLKIINLIEGARRLTSAVGPHPLNRF